MRTTVGPLPPEVYWRRRLALIGILVVAFVGVRAWAGNDSSQAGRQPTAAPSNSASPDGTGAHPYHPIVGAPSPTPSPSPSAAPASSPRALTGPCADSELLLTAVAASREFAMGSQPKLVMAVRNVSSRTCARDLGPRARELVVTSGPAHTWSTDDCHAGTAGSMVTLKPGATVSFTEIWDGRRSQPKCRGDRPVAGSGTYLLQAKLGTLRSDTYVFRLR
ncbi:MAG: hypothetical protein WCB04_00285 [Mycobacteriales bacterium]